MAKSERLRRVWYMREGSVHVSTAFASAKDLVSTCVNTPSISASRYFGTYHGQFVVRDAVEFGKPVAHFSKKDAMIMYLLLLGESQ